MKILIVGAGGHGQVVLDILLAQRAAGDDVEVVGYVDDDPRLQGQERLGTRVLGPLASISSLDHDALIIAVGDNVGRSQLHARLAARAGFATARHPSAIIAGGVSVGEGCMLCARTVVGCVSRLGCGVILNTGSTIDHHASIGDFVHVAPGVHLGGDVSVGAGTLLGIGAVVMPGISIGRRAVVGAGAVVTRDVADHATVVGVPAAPLRARVAGAR